MIPHALIFAEGFAAGYLDNKIKAFNT